MRIMVTARSTGGRADSFRTSFAGYLNDFGTTVTLNARVETLDSMGRITAVTTTSSTIKADIQWVTKNDLKHLNVGDVQVGDGLLFTKHNVTINIEDEIEYDSERWRIVSKVEGEQVQGKVVYRGYVIRKNLE